MLWFDIGTPKYAFFFAKIIPELKNLGYEILVTTRSAPDYTEAKAVLDMHQIPYVISGTYGGQSIEDKFLARLARQQEFLKIFKSRGKPQAVLCGGIPDSIQTAFGLGIPVIDFCDTPIRHYEFSYKEITIGTKLTLPLSSLVFYPFVLPEEIFLKMGVGPEQLRRYDFIDVCLWMDEIVKEDKNDFRQKYGLDPNKKTILIREEEYKAHYVFEKLPTIYELIPKLSESFNANLVIMPRYDSEELKRNFSQYATVLEDKLTPKEFYPFIDLLIGGGGTMNLEAVYYGIPTISTRSLWLYHDKYLMDHGLMKWAGSVDEALGLVEDLLGQKLDNKKYFYKEKPSVTKIAYQIHEYLSCVQS